LINTHGQAREGRTLVPERGKKNSAGGKGNDQLTTLMTQEKGEGRHLDPVSVGARPGGEKRAYPTWQTGKRRREEAIYHWALASKKR